MSRDDLFGQLADQADQMREAGTFKTERVLESPQAARIRVTGGRELTLSLLGSVPLLPQATPGHLQLGDLGGEHL